MSAWNKIEAARWRLLRGPGELARPYLASALYALIPVGAREDVTTVAVDKRWRLYWNDAYVERLEVAQLAAVLYHEVLHLLRAHHARLEAYGHMGNVAGDLEINDDLHLEGFDIVSAGAILPRHFGLPDNLLAEEYLQRLRDQTPSDGGGNDQRNVMAGNCGSCAGPGRDDGDEAGGGISELEADLIRRAVAEAIAAHSSRQPGSVPGHLERWAAEQLRPPQVRWQRLLAANVRRAIGRRAGAVDYSYYRPRRTQAAMRTGGAILPAPYAPQPRVAVVIDTSGSMTTDDLTNCVSEITGIIRAAGGDILLIACDAAVTSVAYTSRTPLTLAGGGGTDMGVGIAEALKHGVDAIVVLTDGYTPWPSQPPSVPVIVCLCTADAQAPQWAAAVRIGGGAA